MGGSDLLRTHPPGVPCWIDNAQPDAAAAARFYGGHHQPVPSARLTGPPDPEAATTVTWRLTAAWSAAFTLLA
jgi:hypothetical protein